MKKKKIIFVILLILIFKFDVYAAGDYLVDGAAYDALGAAVTAAKTSSTHEIILQNDLQTDQYGGSWTNSANNITVEAGETVILNLNNHKLYSGDPGYMYLNIENSGNLTIKNGTFEFYHNKQINSGNLVYDNITFTNFGNITNEGTLTIKNSKISDGTAGAVITNKAGAKVSIDDSEFNVGNIFANEGEFIINSGTYTTTGNLYDGTSGTLVINGGTFNFTNSASSIKLNGGSNTTINGGTFNFSSDGFVFYHGAKSAVLVIKDAIIKSEKAALGSSTINMEPGDNKLVINGGNIESKGEYNLSYVETYINGGTLKTLEGMRLGSAKFVIGENEGTVKETPIIELGEYIYPTGDKTTTIEFYDGKIISKSSDLTKYVTSYGKQNNMNVNIPEGYSIKYDNTDNDRYIAYLVNSTDNSEVHNTSPEENKSSVKEIENPATGITISLIPLIILSIIGIYFIRLSKKKNYIRNL